ncbi:MAG: TIM barrel protein [Chitinivibrionales bacterium]|nr:TIM barrel protein [Chitinivibrionales bacterium]
MKLAFMTLGCPTWDLETICRRGREYGFDGVDFRGLGDQIDVTLLPAFTTDVAATKQRLDSAGLAVSCISSSINVCNGGKREANLEEARRTIDVARALDCVNVRVFGGGDVGTVGREQAAKIGCECVEAILALDGARELHWLFETHDHWIKAADCRLLLDRITDDAFGALWDMGHTFRVGGEAPRDTYNAIGTRIGYTHVKDAVHDPAHPQAMGDGWHYVPPGTGELPLAESIGILREQGYDGWLQFEHEKRWHPELPEPEEVFPVFVKWARGLLAE